MKPAAPFVMSIVLASSALAAENRVKLEDLPPAIQSAVRAQTRDAALTGISKEKEKGKTVYEVETKNSSGKTRDLILDSAGTLIETEEEVDLDSIPAPAKTAIQKKLAGGTIQKVEKLTRGSKISYEAAVKTKSGKSSEIQVSADGR